MSIAKEEYEMQHYGLTSNELADDCMYYILKQITY